jgi:hypothetical protein
VFGVGCGPVTDLTDAGAATLVKGIPLYDRLQVYYYTSCYTLQLKHESEFWSGVTHLFLENPNDGVTEVSKGRLVGGINRNERSSPKP